MSIGLMDVWDIEIKKYKNINYNVFEQLESSSKFRLITCILWLHWLSNSYPR